MPKRSAAELELMKQQEQLILKGDKISQIFIGAQSGKHSSSEKAKAGTIDPFLRKIEYKHAVLDPATHLNAAWQVYLNEAFISGAILSKRKVKLVTDFSFYEKFFNTFNALNNGTFYELLALKENGFEFRKDYNGKILAVPISVPSIPKLECFEDYELIFTASKQNQRELMSKKFEAYKDRALALIQAVREAQILEEDVATLSMYPQMVALDAQHSEVFGKSQHPSDNTDESAPPIKKHKTEDQEPKNPEVPLREPSFSCSKPNTYTSKRPGGPS